MVPQKKSDFSIMEAIKLCFKRFELKPEYLPFPKTANEWNQRFELELNEDAKKHLDKKLKEGISDPFKCLLRSYDPPLKCIDYEFHDDLEIGASCFDKNMSVSDIFSDYSCSIERSNLHIFVQPESDYFTGLSLFQMGHEIYDYQLSLDPYDLITFQRVYKELVQEGRIPTGFELKMVNDGPY